MPCCATCLMAKTMAGGTLFLIEDLSPPPHSNWFAEILDFWNHPCTFFFLSQKIVHEIILLSFLWTVVCTVPISYSATPSFSEVEPYSHVGLCSHKMVFVPQQENHESREKSSVCGPLNMKQRVICTSELSPHDQQP